MAERNGRRRQPLIFKDFIGVLEDSDLRNFERACESLHKILEDILDTKSGPNGDGLRETETLRIGDKKIFYDFKVAEENTTIGESKNIVVVARPVSDFPVADRVVVRVAVNGKITTILSESEEPLGEGDYGIIKNFTEMLKFMQENLPDPPISARRFRS